MDNDLASEFFTLVVYAGLVMPPVIQILRRAGYSLWWAVAGFIPFGNLFVFASLGPEVLRRAGYNPRWTLIVFVPLFGLVPLWIFAFGTWPGEVASRAKADEWSPADNETFKRLLQNR
jgi:hypothetical protein